MHFFLGMHHLFECTRGVRTTILKIGIRYYSYAPVFHFILSNVYFNDPKPFIFLRYTYFIPVENTCLDVHEGN